MTALPPKLVSTKCPGILHICKVYLPEKGGIQRVIHNITAAINGYQHTVLTTTEQPSSDSEPYDGARVVRCRSFGQIASMPISPTLLLQVIRRVRSHDVLAIHYPFPLADLASLLVPFSPPIVVHWHSKIVAQKRLKWLVAPLTLIMLLRARAIIVTSERMIEQSSLLQRFRNKIKIIPYGLPPLADNRADASIDEDYFILIGRHVSYKGIDVAIKALANTDARLVIAGDGPLIERHRLLAKELCVSDRVQFITDACDESVERMLRKSTALIIPSVMENEAFALVQIEAMRLSKPVINTDLSSSVPWVARNDMEAVTVPPSNVKALSGAMQRLLQDKEYAARLGKSGLHRFEEIFTQKQFAEALKKTYSEVMQD